MEFNPNVTHALYTSVFVTTSNQNLVMDTKGKVKLSLCLTETYGGVDV
jgi:hypothetical protein